MLPADTTAEAQAVQDAAYRRMTPGEKLQALLDLSAGMRSLARLGVSMRHPELDEKGISRRLVKDLYGIDLPAR